VGKSFNRYIKNFARHQAKLDGFIPNRLNSTLAIEPRSGRHVITNYEGPVFVECNLVVNADGICVDVASDSEQRYGTSEIFVSISMDDVLGFPYDVTNEKDHSESLGDDDNVTCWYNEDLWPSGLRELYRGWNLEFGRRYWFRKAVLKASDELVAAVKLNSGSRFDRVIEFYS